MLIDLWQEEGAVKSAAVCPRVIEGDFMNVNGSCLNITVLCPLPLQTVAEIFMQDLSTRVVVVENLRGGIKKETKGNFMNILIIQGRFEKRAHHLLDSLL